jgi:hypothetical protein
MSNSTKPMGSAAISQLSQSNTARTINQRSLELVRRLACVDAAIKAEYVDPLVKYYAAQTPPVSLVDDPVNIAWELCRQGGALCALINKFRSNTIAKINAWDEPVSPAGSTSASAKANLQACLAACKDDLYMTDEQLFPPPALYTPDTNILNKAVDLANTFMERIKKTQAISFEKRVAALMAADLLYADPQPAEGEAEKHKRLLVFDELLDTERKYVADLDLMLKFEEELRIDKCLGEDALRGIFSNLDKLTDFQRGFLIALEKQIVGAARTLQNSYACHIGPFFRKYEQQFAIYDEFCSNHKNAADLATEQALAMMPKASIIDPVTVLPSFLIKPIQRICKYPLLFREIIKNSPKDAPDLKELEEAEAAMKRVGDRVNEKHRRAENALIAQELIGRVDDWKGLDHGKLGELELFEHLTVSQGTVEKEVECYLFSAGTLIMCREGKGLVSFSRVRKSKAQLQIRGTIQLNMVTQLERCTDDSLRIILGSESFVLKFRNEELAGKWAKALERLSGKTVYAAGQAPLTAREKRLSRALLVEQRLPAMAAVAAPNVKPPLGMAAPLVSAGVSSATTIENFLRLKLGYGSHVYQVLINELESLEQVKQLALDRIARDYESMNMQAPIAVADMRCHYRDEFGDVITMLDDTDLFEALQYNPNVLMVVIKNKSDWKP